MSGYDPKRTRPPAVDVDVDEPAPVDAFLTPEADAPSAADSSQSVPAEVLDDPIPVDVPVAPAPDRLTARLAVVGGVAAAAVAAVLLIRRSRRR